MNTYGLPLRADDYGNTVATATALTGTPSGSGVTSYVVAGIITSALDVDMMSLQAVPGTLSLTLSPATRSANLDALVTLYTSNGAVLATSNPVDALNAALTYTLTTAGLYIVGVRGTGKGDPLVTGYTSYGSVGNYVLSVSAPSGSPPTVALTASPTSGTYPLAVTFSAVGTVDDGSVVSLSWNFGDGSPVTTTSDPATPVSHTYTSVGTFTASVTVTDDAGLYSTRSVTIVSNGFPPTAVATGTPTTGTLPFTVQFSGVGSTDVDGSIASYSWNFGDGTTGTGATVSHTYTGSARSFSVVLTVRDNDGLSATSGLTIVGNAPPMFVGSISLTASRNNRKAVFSGAVVVKTSSGAVVPSATVSATWSGIVSGSQTATTNSAGVASFSIQTNKSGGSATLTVTGITKSGYVYSSASNVVTSATVANPL